MDRSTMLIRLGKEFEAVRAETEARTVGLTAEDMQVSSMPDVSPTKWHLAHTSWFWEEFVLKPHMKGYVVFDDSYSYLFNSYYVQAGERHCRAQRGLVTRPYLVDILKYRNYVTEAVLYLLSTTEEDLTDLIRLGMAHEQQHQELMLTDIQHVLWSNPAKPALDTATKFVVPKLAVEREGYVPIAEGLYAIGAITGAGQFVFDNEKQRHKQWLESFRINRRLVTNGEYMEFVQAGGYQDAKNWLSAGFGKYDYPLYWDQMYEYTLRGVRARDAEQPVVGISYYEADAFARWRGERLPTEAEWEVAASTDMLDDPFGSVWQWTRSAYLPYPRFRVAHGAIGEYNGKWMADQWVLKGSSFATPTGHSRLSYRNFWPSDTRWQYTGIRLVRD